MLCIHASILTGQFSAIDNDNFDGATYMTFRRSRRSIVTLELLHSLVKNFKHLIVVNYPTPLTKPGEESSREMIKSVGVQRMGWRTLIENLTKEKDRGLES
jgi:hypothetical protein